MNKNKIWKEWRQRQRPVLYNISMTKHCCGCLIPWWHHLTWQQKYSIHPRRYAHTSFVHVKGTNELDYYDLQHSAIFWVCTLKERKKTLSYFFHCVHESCISFLQSPFILVRTKMNELFKADKFNFVSFLNNLMYSVEWRSKYEPTIYPDLDAQCR